MRTPNYVRGVEGTVFSILGIYRDPTGLARGDANAPYECLYRVHFASEAVKGMRIEEGHTITVDLYENWLEEAAHE